MLAEDRPWAQEHIICLTILQPLSTMSFFYFQKYKPGPYKFRPLQEDSFFHFSLGYEIFKKSYVGKQANNWHSPPPLFSFALMKNTDGKRILNMFIMDMEITSDHCQIDILKISFIFLKIGQSLLNICSSGSQSPWGFSSDLSNQTLPSPTSELGGLFFWVFVSENEEKLGRERKRSGSKPEVINL